MSTSTQFQQLTKPALADALDVAVLNANFDKIDKVGTILCTAATRPSTNLFAGLTIYETDTKNTYKWNGTAWIINTANFLCTSGTRPTGATLYEGFRIYETDTNLAYIYDGANWILQTPKTSLVTNSPQGSGGVVTTVGQVAGICNALTVVSVPYQTLAIVSWGALLATNATATDQTDVSLRRNGSTVVQSARCIGSSCSSSGVFFEVIPANSTIAYQLIATKQSGTGVATFTNNGNFSYTNILQIPIGA